MTQRVLGSQEAVVNFRLITQFEIIVDSLGKFYIIDNIEYLQDSGECLVTLIEINEHLNTSEYKFPIACNEEKKYIFEEKEFMFFRTGLLFEDIQKNLIRIIKDKTKKLLPIRL